MKKWFATNWKMLKHSECFSPKFSPKVKNFPQACLRCLRVLGTLPSIVITRTRTRYTQLRKHVNPVFVVLASLAVTPLVCLVFPLLFYLWIALAAAAVWIFGAPGTYKYFQLHYYPTFEILKLLANSEKIFELI